MISHTGSLFNDGPVRRAVETALRSQESDGAVGLDDELKRFVRTARASGASSWLFPVPSIAALLDHTADLLETADAAFFPRTFFERLDKAREGVPGGEYLHTLAGLIRLAEQDQDATFGELPLAEWEARVRFPELSGFGPNWIYEGEYATPAESIQAYIEAEHPFCSEVFPRITSEAQSALVLFPETDALAANVGRAFPWVTHDALREVLQGIDDHMRREH